MNADHAKITELLTSSKDPEVVYLCQAYLERTAEVMVLKEKLRRALARFDNMILDLADEGNGI